MKSFLHVSDIGNLGDALAQARQVKRTPHAWKNLGTDKTIMLVFFNSSLRTRLSSQKAALNLGMDPIVLNINQDSWRLETRLGEVMDADRSEHIREAIPVMASYCDLIGIRSFAGLSDREYDYSESVLNSFIEYGGKPVISLESATVHPCQAFADLITIEEYRKTSRPKVVLTWAPHPRALPQAVPNSFAEWMDAANVELVITHPRGYELDPAFTGDARVEYDQMKAFEGADFVYAKNWSCPGVTNPKLYGQILSQDADWTVGRRQMAVTNDAYFMHCLPVRRNVVVTDEILDGPGSLVIPEAANRVVSAQVVMKKMLEEL